MTREILSIEAWRGFRLDEFPYKSWQFEAPSLRAIGNTEPIDLITRKPYQNFILYLEWRLPPAGNSGVLYRVSEDSEQSWQSGPEMQLVDDIEHPNGETPETSCGALYALLAPEQAYFPADNDFNTAQLSVRGNRVEHHLNGSKVLNYGLADPALEHKIAGSVATSWQRCLVSKHSH